MYRVKKVAAEPLQTASFQALPGLRVSIQKVRIIQDDISITVDECMSRLLFDRDVDTAGPGNSYLGAPMCTYVLYHPGSGEAFVVSQQNVAIIFPAMLSGESRISGWASTALPVPCAARTPRRRDRRRLAARSPPVRVCARVRRHVAPGFSPGKLRLADQRKHRPGQKENLDAAQVIAGITLPANPTTAQLNAYFDQILLNIPESWNDSLRKTVLARLSAPGVSGLPISSGNCRSARTLRSFSFSPSFQS